MIKTTLMGFTAALLLLSQQVYAEKPAVFATGEGAIRGYDPVAYFTVGEPTKGSDQYSFEWEGETFKFTNAENLAIFKADPGKYAPRYGGYCAYAVSEGYTASTVPKAWAIVDDRLYLNYSLEVRKRWAKDIPGRIAAADKNWPGVLN
jgi:YHS domain-containing protein